MPGGPQNRRRSRNFSRAMENEPQQSPSEAGLEELVQAMISAEHLATPAEQLEVRHLLEALPGVRSVNFLEGRLQVCYDPLQITEKELEAAIDRTGHHPLGGESERASPFADL